MITRLSCCLLMSTVMHAATPSMKLIISEMAKCCIAGDASWQGMKSNGDEKSFLSVSLRNNDLTVTAGETVVKSYGAQLPANDGSFYFVKALLGCNNTGVSIENYLRIAGVNSQKISHGIFDYEPVFIIGAEPGDSSSPQLWIEKKNFVPVKEIEGGRVTTFKKWTASRGLANKKFPSLIETRINDLVERVAISEKLFVSHGG